MRARHKKKDKRKVVHEGRFLKFITCGEWEYVKRNNCTAIVIIAALTANREILFVEQYRPPMGKLAVEFPAGLVNDRGLKTRESRARAAKRELLEETGYRAGTLLKILEGPVSSGCSADRVTMFMATDVQKETEGGGDEFESIKVHKIPLDAADAWLEKMRKKGRLIEPKIYAGLYFLKSYNKQTYRRTTLKRSR